MASVISKSVARVFEILELFRETKKPMRAVDIRNALGYPQPSTLALLKNMLELGYVSFDRKAKTYFPTARLGLLGHWVQTAIVGGGYMADLVDELSSKTEETASICAASDIQAQIIYTCTADHALALQVKPGPVAPLCSSAVGRTLLSVMTDEEITDTVKDTNRRERLKRSRVTHNLVDIIATARTVRERGYMASYDLFLPGVGVIAFPINDHDNNQVLVLAVAGGKDRVKSKEAMIVRTMKSDIRRYGLALKNIAPV